MSKTAVNYLITEVKREADYNITDSSLDTMLINFINKALKRVKQLFLDNGLWDEITAHDTFSTVADQEYIELGTETVDFDQHMVLSERTNDSIITIIPFSEYRAMYPDPSSDKSGTPDVAAFFANSIYFGPTPSDAITIYFDYIKLVSDVASGGTMPFEDKYDPLIIAMVMEQFVKFLGRNLNEITFAKSEVQELKHELIIAAAKNIGLNQQCHSRRGDKFGPKKQLTRPTYGYGMGGYGEGGYGGL